MLSLLGPRGRLCDSPSRRDLLTAGSLPLFGLALPGLLRSEARARADPPAKGGSGFGSAKAVVLLYLQGSPSHIDTWDPKPDAPEGIRGEFRPIDTSVPGVRLTEVLPRLARQTHRFTLIRSLGVKPQGLANHGASIYMLMTGAGPLNFSPTGLSVPPSRQDLPSVGAVAARYKPVEPGRLGFVSVCGPIQEGAVTGVGQSAGVLGAAYDPFQMYQDPQHPLNVETLTLPPDVTLGRMKARFDLRAVRPGPAGAAGFDAHYDTALALLGSAATARAFRLEDEPPRVRDRYGRTRWGQSCLLARRLVEAGTRFVQVNWPAGSDTEPAPGPDGSWDTHRNNFPMLKNWRCPVFDQTAAALLEDLDDRGLLDTTLVVMVGEFGRSPKIGAPTTDNVGPGGRDHWPSCYTCLVAGGGVRPGRVYGESDRYGAYPQKNAAHPYDLIATLYHALGIDPGTQYRDSLDRPRGLVEHGGPILGLF
jgi:Protein of unknown function (DUF1501)